MQSTPASLQLIWTWSSQSSLACTMSIWCCFSLKCHEAQFPALSVTSVYMQRMLKIWPKYLSSICNSPTSGFQSCAPMMLSSNHIYADGNRWRYQNQMGKSAQPICYQVGRYWEVLDWIIHLLKYIQVLPLSARRLLPTRDLLQRHIVCVHCCMLVAMVRLPVDEIVVGRQWLAVIRRWVSLNIKQCSGEEA